MCSIVFANDVKFLLFCTYFSGLKQTNQPMLSSFVYKLVPVLSISKKMSVNYWYAQRCLWWAYTETLWNSFLLKFPFWKDSLVTGWSELDYNVSILKSWRALNSLVPPAFNVLKYLKNSRRSRDKKETHSVSVCGVRRIPVRDGGSEMQSIYMAGTFQITSSCIH